MVRTEMSKTEMALMLTVYKQKVEELQEANTKLKQDLKVRNQKVDNALEWFNLFVDFVGNNYRNAYNDACEYADEIQSDE